MLEYFKKIKKQRGSSLLLALFVMGAMVIVGLGTASLSVNQIRQSREIRKSTIAFYTAEAGIEEALYQWRKNELIDDVEDLWGYEVVSFTDNNATTSLSFVDYEEEIVDYLKVNEVVSLDLYSTDDLSSSGDIKSITLEWDGKPGSWLQVTWKSLNSPSYFSDNIYIQKRFVPFQEGLTHTINLTAGIGQGGNYAMHLVQIRAMYDEVKNLRIKAYPTNSGTGNSADIPSRVYFSSLGEYPKGASGRAQYNITVSLPEKKPLSPLFDFVIFSEEDITKTILLTGSTRPQIIFQYCGPYLFYPDCQYTFTTSNPYTFVVESIGIQAATIIENPTISPLGQFQILPASCVGGLQLEYGDTCNIVVRPLTSSGDADLSIVTSTLESALKMKLYSR